MSSNIFNPIEIDAIGEIMNISLGSSATAVSNMLDHRVDITTPKVSVENAEDFQLGPLDPAIGVEIKYVAGLEGSNIMLLKLSDVKTIVDILMGSETPEDEFELNEFTLSAVREIMNQMMGAASTALSDFLGRMVNISTPETFDLNNLEEFKETRLPVKSGPLVRVSFNLKIEDSLESEFMNVMSIELARELVAGFGLGDDSVENNPLTAEGSSGVLNQDEIERLMHANDEANAAAEASSQGDSGGGMLSQDEIEKLMAQSMGQSAPPPAPEPSSGGGKLSQDEIEKLMSQSMGQSAPPPTPEPSSGGGKLSQDEIEKLMAKTSAPAAAPAAPATPAQPAQPAAAPAVDPNAAAQYPQYPGGYPPYPYYMAPPQGWPQQAAPPEPKVIATSAVPMPKLEQQAELDEEQAQNLDLIMSVPLEVTVEIGRTKRKVKDILTFAKGSLVVLDKLAGDQVDLFVNGKCIAKGDVVVIDDNFGIRITEIVKKSELEEIATKT